MKRNRHRLSRFVAARIPAMRAARAWRALLPDWTPDQADLEELDARPREHRQAVRVLMYGIPYTDPRWDVLAALLEWERREERKRRDAADELTRLNEEMDPLEERALRSKRPAWDDNVISMDEEYERMRYDSEVTVETPMPGMKVLQQHVDDMLDIVRQTKPVERSDKPVRRYEDGAFERSLTLVPRPGTPKVFTVRTLKSIREEQDRAGQ